jgi:hypothetical protein
VRGGIVGLGDEDVVLLSGRGGREHRGDGDELFDNGTEKLKSGSDLSFGRRSLTDGGNDSDGVALGGDVVSGRDRGDVDV